MAARSRFGRSPEARPPCTRASTKSRAQQGIALGQVHAPPTPRFPRAVALTLEQSSAADVFEAHRFFHQPSRPAPPGPQLHHRSEPLHRLIHACPQAAGRARWSIKQGNEQPWGAAVRPCSINGGRCGRPSPSKTMGPHCRGAPPRWRRAPFDAVSPKIGGLAARGDGRRRVGRAGSESLHGIASPAPPDPFRPPGAGGLRPPGRPEPAACWRASRSLGWQVYVDPMHWLRVPASSMRPARRRCGMEYRHARP